jgi:putative salt-induced outer membrane protein YdiY
VTCEIKRLVRGKLEAKTDDMGTLQIKWDKIERLRSEYLFDIELQSGRRFFGSIDYLEEENKFVIDQFGERTAVEHLGVVTITPVDESIWQRFNGSLDLGYGFTQAETATEWNGNASVDYRTLNWHASGEFSSHLKKQEGANDVTRNSVNFSLTRFFSKRWLALGLLRNEQNSSQELVYRNTVGGGIGRNLVHTNRVNFGIAGGAVAANEVFVDQDLKSSVEGFGGIQFDFYRFHFPNMDISTYLYAFPSLTAWGRVRLEFDSKIRIEILRDLYWSLNLYNSFDSDPPSETANRNDFGISTSLGWKF